MPPRWCRGSWTEGPRFRWRSPARSSRPAAAKRTGMRRSGCWRCWRRVEMASPRPNRTARGRCCRCASDAAGPARTDAAAGAALGGDADLGVRFPRLCGLRRDGAGDDRALSAGRRRIGSRWAALPTSRGAAPPGLRGGLGALSLSGTAGAEWVFFPSRRVPSGGLRRASRPAPVAGLGDRVDLSRRGTIADDPRVALRVRLNPPPRGEPRDLAMHWRARSLSQWTGHGWRSPDGGLIPVMRLPRRPRGGGVPSVLSTDIEVVGQVTDRVVFTPEGWPLGVDFRRPGSPRQLYRNVEGDLFYQPVDGGDVRYTVAADLDEPAPRGP